MRGYPLSPTLGGGGLCADAVTLKTVCFEQWIDYA